LAVHRADLHSALLHAATTHERSGKPCRIIHGCKVAKLVRLFDVLYPRTTLLTQNQYPEDGTVELEDGTRYVGDVVVGADGSKSATRSFIVPDAPAPRACGDAAYRFLIQLEDLKAINHPLLKDDLIPPTLHMVVGPKRKMIAYPCRNGTALNCVAYLREFTSFFTCERELIPYQRSRHCVMRSQSLGHGHSRERPAVWCNHLRYISLLGRRFYSMPVPFSSGITI
jgi:2-polyprenyl-6-methoxyphenol hydroxylase-like FAD-dependent oxidoreductase